MLHFETIEPATLELLRSILSISELNSTRLVGGTSLALQLGHRKSVDLDFFGKIPYNTQELSGILSSVGNVKILQDSKNIHIFLINGVKVDSFMALKSLLYFDDAEKDIMPIMIKEQSWHEIKEKITRSVNELS